MINKYIIYELWGSGGRRRPRRKRTAKKKKKLKTTLKMHKTFYAAEMSREAK